MFREGNFWRAYERSAYAFVKHVNSLKAVKRAYKALDGDTLVYVGFPTSSENKYLEGRAHHIVGDRLIVPLAETIDQTQYEQWKAQVPQKEAMPSRPLSEVVSSIADGGVQPLPETVQAVVAALLRYDLALATPVDTMQFIAQLKRMLKQRVKDDNGTT